jgi:hypothetical protein
MINKIGNKIFITKMGIVIGIIGILVLESQLTYAEEKHYLDIDFLKINFDKNDATFTVNYSLDKITRVYELLFGSKNLEPKIYDTFSNFNYSIIKMDEEHAVLRVTNISRFDKGYYLHDPRVKFGEIIRKLYIYFPDDPVPRDYYNVNSTPIVFYRALK